MRHQVTHSERRGYIFCDKCDEQKDAVAFINGNLNKQSEKKADKTLNNIYFKLGWTRKRKKDYCPECSKKT